MQVRNNRKGRGRKKKLYKLKSNKQKYKKLLFNFVRKYRLNKNRKTNIAKSTKKDIYDISRLFKLLLNGGVPLSPTHIKKLKKHKTIFYNFLKTKNVNAKRKYLMQKGAGVFSVLLPTAISLLTSLFAK